MYKYYKYALITLICCLSATSFAIDNIQKTTNNFNFKNLSNQKHYAALEYGEYDPAKAIEACRNSPNSIPKGGIWPADPSNPFPSPEPNPDDSDCEISTQMAYGCNNYMSSIGRALTKSVVGIMILHRNKNVWIQFCTGTVIDNQWVLTAAHCVVDKEKHNLISASSLIVVPWQELGQTGKFGVPTILEPDALSTYEAIKVRAVNILKTFIDAKSDSYSPDLALLKIKPIKPYMGLEPIPVTNNSLLSKPETPIILGGYGYKEDQGHNGQLRYRKSYYMTNIYNKNWKGGVSGNYGDIYILGSKPIDYKGIQSAWSFTGQGDSGGPVLSYNALTHKFQIEGVISAALFCGYAGYFAQLPYPYYIAASTTYPKNYDFIKSVINGAPDLSQVRCNGECFFNKTLYVLNQTSNNINNYQFDYRNNLLLRSKNPTGVYPTQIAFSPDNNTAFVTNFMSNSITRYDVENGSLSYPYTINLAEGYKGPVDIAFLSDKDMFVIAKNSHLLLQYSSAFIIGWYMYEALQTLMNPTHLNVISIYNRTLLLASNENEIDVYEWYKSKRKLADTYYKIKLTSDMGQLIEIKPFGGPNNRKFYALTTRGVYIYQPTISNEDITFRVIGNLSYHFASDSHLVPLYKNSFAISNKFSDRVFVYEVTPDNTIALENYITIPEPGEMAFDDGVLYISSFPRSLYSYTISYPHLYISSEPKIVETGEGPTIIKINKRNYSEM